MYKNEGLQKQNKANRRCVGRTIGGFCHGDIYTAEKDMEIIASLTQPK